MMTTTRPIAVLFEMREQHAVTIFINSYSFENGWMLYLHASKNYYAITV